MRLVESFLLHFLYVDLFDSPTVLLFLIQAWSTSLLLIISPISVLYSYVMILGFWANPISSSNLSHSVLMSWLFSQDLLLDQNTLLSFAGTEFSLFFSPFVFWYSFMVLIKQLLYSILLYSLLISLHLVVLSFQPLI